MIYENVKAFCYSFHQKFHFLTFYFWFKTETKKTFYLLNFSFFYTSKNLEIYLLRETFCNFLTWLIKWFNNFFFYNFSYSFYFFLRHIFISNISIIYFLKFLISRRISKLSSNNIQNLFFSALLFECYQCYLFIVLNLTSLCQLWTLPRMVFVAFLLLLLYLECYGFERAFSLPSSVILPYIPSQNLLHAASQSAFSDFPVVGISSSKSSSCCNLKHSPRPSVSLNYIVIQKLNIQ